MTQENSDQLMKGFRLQQAGRLDDAERLYRLVLSTSPDNVHALNLLGVLCVNSARPQEALPLIEHAGKIDPRDADTWSNLGLALKDLRQLEQAIAAFTRATQIRPNDAVAHNRLGNALGEIGCISAAIDANRKALRLAPHYADCLINLSGALLSQGHLNAASAAVERAIEQNPQAAAAHNTLGEVLRKRFHYETAAECYRTAVRLRPDYDAAWINLSAVLKEIGEVDQARRILGKVVGRQPANPHAQICLGSLLEQMGDLDGAAARFRHAITSCPSYAQAYYQLAHLGGHALSDEEMTAAAALLKNSQTSDEERIPLAFALAAACEARGDPDRSFAHLTLAQSLKRKKSPYDDASVRAYYTSIKKSFATSPAPAGHRSGRTAAPGFRSRDAAFGYQPY